MYMLCIPKFDLQIQKKTSVMPVWHSTFELSDPDLTPESREELEAVKQTHIDEAVIQRRAVSALNNL